MAGQHPDDDQGAKRNPGSFANDPARAREAGQRGGTHQGKATNPGNFANNRDKAAEAGRKGGQATHGPRPGKG